VLTKYRNRLQIVAEILEIAKAGAKKTHIMYRANLSYSLLCRYLKDILDCGLVKVDREASYVVAPKGERFLKRFHSYVKRRENVGKMVDQVRKERALLEERFMNAKDDTRSQGAALLRKR
jgi:predicted transcriptional regulator